MVQFKFADYTQSAGVLKLNGGDIAASKSLKIQGGSLSGTGVITGTVLNAGQVTPGGTASPGILTIRGSSGDKYMQEAMGTLAIEIGGLTPGSQFDQLNVSSLATLTGTLSISLTNGFTPNLGDRFPIMTAGSRSGQFAAIHGLEIGNGKRFQVNYSAGGVTLEVVSASSFPSVAGTLF